MGDSQQRLLGHLLRFAQRMGRQHNKMADAMLWALICSMHTRLRLTVWIAKGNGLLDMRVSLLAGRN